MVDRSQIRQHMDVIASDGVARSRLLIACLLSLVTGAVAAFAPLALKELIDRLAAGQPAAVALPFAGLYVAALAAGRLIATMTEIVDGVAGGSVPGGSGRARPAEAPTATSLRREILTSIDMWAEVMGSVVETSLDVLPHGIPFGLEDDHMASAVHSPLRPGQPGPQGSRRSASYWGLRPGCCCSRS